jgi:anti-sigma B factor antagonist
MNDVMVLQISGDIVEEELWARDLLRTAREVMGAGYYKLVLDLERVDFLSSTGLGALVQVKSFVSKQGGRLWLCAPSAKVRHVFTLTHLTKVFEFAQPEDVVGIQVNGQLAVACPSCTQPTSWIDVIANKPLSCRSCGIELTLSASSIATAQKEIDCETLRIPTYENEHVKLVIAGEQVIAVEGRLDLFASEAVVDIWRLVPRPRRIIFAVPYVGMTSAGLQPLIELCAVSNHADRSAIVVTGAIESPDSLPRHPSVHTDWQAARASLGAAAALPPKIRLRTRRT